MTSQELREMAVAVVGAVREARDENREPSLPAGKWSRERIASALAEMINDYRRLEEYFAILQVVQEDQLVDDGSWFEVTDELQAQIEKYPLFSQLSDDSDLLNIASSKFALDDVWWAFWEDGEDFENVAEESDDLSEI